MTGIVESIGGGAISAMSSFRSTIFAAAVTIFKAFNKEICNSASFSVLISQIYFTAVEILPMFIAISVLLGTLVMGILFQTIKEIGLDQHLGRILVGFAVTELSPFVTVLLLALRSSSAINTEIAVMKVNREIDTLTAFRIDADRYLFIPRIVNGMISLVLLNGLFSIILVTSGLIFSKLIFGMGLATYSQILAGSVHLSDSIILVAKCLTFGFFITLIPILSGLRATYDVTTIPVSVLHGMIRVFLAIILIEVLSLVARFI
ncbi:MAG: ABC transporter permease [Deltaproteobacteria bacterium]|nr:ABC transporter permease [Deltaproteobacteria bacterium]MBN2687987.1 ABC transporter permease [Deltaproteobacteria bacterium]